MSQTQTSDPDMAANSAPRPWWLVGADWIERGLDALLALMLFVLVACLCWQVYGRYVLNHAPGWTEEVARFLMVYVTMLGSAVVMRRHGHIEVTALVDALPRRLRLAVLWLRDAVVLASAGVLIWYGYGLAEIGGQRLSPALEIRMYWPFLSIPVSGALMAFFLCVRRMEHGAEDAPRTELI